MRTGVVDQGETRGEAARGMEIFWDLMDATVSVRKVMEMMVGGVDFGRRLCELERFGTPTNPIAYA